VQGATRDDDDDEDDEDDDDGRTACRGDERADAEESSGALDDDVIEDLGRGGRGFSLKFKHLCSYSGSGVTRSARRW
jgi:hypothetical protein